MKNLIVVIFVCCAVSLMTGQESVRDNVQKNFFVKSLNSTGEIDTYNYVVKEKEMGEFLRDPLLFVENNFDMTELIRLFEKEKYHRFEVTFSCAKGYINASYSKDGELIKTTQVFKNKNIPREVMMEIYKNYKGWKVVKTKFVAKGTANNIDSYVYKIKLRNGEKTKRIKLRSSPLNNDIVIN